MKKRILKKLRSERGASITFALLLFLVCAVVGSVVLAAGTVAAGRIANMARMDQKYFSVASAVQLLEEELDKKTVTIVRTEKSTEKTVNGVASAPEKEWKTVIDGGTRIEISPSGSINSLDDIKDTSSNPMSFLTEQAVSLMFWEPSNSSFHECNITAAMGYPFSGRSEAEIRRTDFKIAVSGSTGGSDLDIEGICTLKGDGTLVIEVKDAMKLDEDTEDPYHYSLFLTLSPSIRETESVSTEGGDVPVVTTDDSGNRVETLIKRRTVTKTSEITWTATNIRKEE